MDSELLERFNDLIYRIYDEENFLTSREIILWNLRNVIPYSYASILINDIDNKTPRYIDPFANPQEFLHIESSCVNLYNKALNDSDTTPTGLICSNRDVTDLSVIYGPVYSKYYKKLYICDVCKLHIEYNGVYLGVLSLYRTRKLPPFSKDELFLLSLLEKHLCKYFYHEMVADEIGDRIRERVSIMAEEFDLTPREAEILSYVLKGYTDNEISKKLFISPETFRHHLHSIYRKTATSFRWELCRYV